MAAEMNVAWPFVVDWYLKPWLGHANEPSGDRLSNDAVSRLFTTRCGLPSDHPGVRTHVLDDPLERLHLVLPGATPGQVACILEGILEIAPIGSSPQRTAKIGHQLNEIINHARAVAEIQDWEDLQAERATQRNLPTVQTPVTLEATAPQVNTAAQRDIFISHASEDKIYVRKLVHALQTFGITVWYDEFEIQPGYSIREEIARGLAASTYGLVVLSRAFMNPEKKWTHQELGGLRATEQPRQKQIIPIWLDITRDDVLAYDAILADLHALDANALSTEQIAERINRRLQADRSIGPQ